MKQQRKERPAKKKRLKMTDKKKLKKKLFFICKDVIITLINVQSDFAQQILQSDFDQDVNCYHRRALLNSRDN